jgi:hydroxyacylglutathione hydrolase
MNREAKVIRELRKMEKATVGMLVPPVYDDVPSFLHPVARYSLLAHLIKLEEEKRAVQSDNFWRWIGKD